MTHDWLGNLHLFAAFSSLLSGVFVFRAHKGGKRHKQLGYWYVISMLTVAITALAIYRLTGAFNILHIAALVTLFSIGGGLRMAWLRRKRSSWLEGHYEFMVWSYIGLLAALVAESSTRIAMPLLVEAGYGDLRSWFWSLVGVATFFVIFFARGYWEKQRPKMRRYQERYDRAVSRSAENIS